MKNDLKHISLTTSYEIDNSFDSEKFIKMRLRVCHDGENPNGSSFSVSNMENADSSLLNIPILAHVIFDEDGNPQFGSHDMELEVNKLNEDELKLIYKEVPIGVIPETNNSEIKVFDNKNYVYTDCFVWRGYSNYAEDIINRDKDIKLSMEILVDNYKYDSKTKIYEITEYRYTGITFLGNNKGTGMLNALATTEVFSEEDNKEKIISIMEELKEEISKYQLSLDSNDINNGKKEDEILFTDEIRDLILKEYDLKVEDLNFKIDENITEDDFKIKIKEFVDNRNESDKLKLEKFSATYNQKRDALRNVLDSEYEYDVNNKLIKETYYWVQDFDDEYVYVERSIWTKDDYNCDNGRYAYSFDKSTLSASLTNEFELMVLKWLTIEENQKLEQSRNAFEELKSEFETYKAEYSYKNDEVETLKTFKENKEKEQHKFTIENKLSEFEDLFENSEFILLKEKATDFSVDELEKELLILRGKSVKPKFSKQTKENNFIKLPITHEKDDESDVLYGGFFDRYLKRK